MHPDAIIGKWIEFLLKTFIVLFIKVLRSSSGAFYQLVPWTHAKLASEDLVNILKINEHDILKINEHEYSTSSPTADTQSY